VTAYIIRRLLATIPVMAVVALFVFFLLRIAPGDPAAIIAGDNATAEGHRGRPRQARPRPADGRAVRRLDAGSCCGATWASRSSPTCR
jgi:ABC-type microcin C transport system permease subunit YejB